jgi:hypothetical protein
LDVVDFVVLDEFKHPKVEDDANEITVSKKHE